MTSRNKRKGARSKKSRVGTARSHDTFESVSGDLGLLIASDTSDEARELVQETIKESLEVTNDDSAVFDTAQMQLDSQLQNELDSYIVHQQSLQEQVYRSRLHTYEGFNRNGTPLTRSSVFDSLEKNGNELEKSTMKSKCHTEDLDTSLLGGLEKPKKMRRKVKTSSHDQ